MTEQRMINLSGEVYQRIIFGYDAKGNPLPPKSETYDVKAPDMRAAPIDFTKNQEPPRSLDRSQGSRCPAAGKRALSGRAHDSWPGTDQARCQWQPPKHTAHRTA